MKLTYFQLQDWDGRAPNLYDISGSAHFVNKCDNGIVIHRDRNLTTDLGVEVHNHHFCFNFLYAFKIVSHLFLFYLFRYMCVRYEIRFLVQLE